MFQQNETSSLLPYVSAGLTSSTCLISMPKENAFAITGGLILSMIGSVFFTWFYFSSKSYLPAAAFSVCQGFGQAKLPIGGLVREHRD